MLRKYRQIHFGLTIIVMLFSQFAFAQTLDTIQLSNKQSVLNDRAFFSLPAAAKNEAMGVDIMSSDKNINEETRFVFDIGKMRLVLLATEVYLLADKNFQTSIENNNSKINFKTKVLIDKDSLLSILSIPTQFDKTKEAILVNNLLVKTQDNTLFRIDAYINPEAFELKDEFQKLTEKIFSSITKGTRVNLLTERTEILPAITGKQNFVFKVPANYCITKDKKYDFEVFKFHKFNSFSEAPNFQQLIIYTGFYPSEVYKDFNLTEKDALKIKGKFLGQDIDWLQFDIKTQGIIDKEQKITVDKIQAGIILHVAMISNQQIIIDNLTKIVENIKLTE